LARTSLLLVLGMLSLAAVASCLVSPTPSDLQPARVTPPYLSGFDPDPSKVWVIDRANPGGAVATFRASTGSVNVVSEDLGNNLQALLLLDYQGESTSLAAIVQIINDIPAGHIDDPPPLRSIKIDFTLPPGTPAGCHSLTLIVTHGFKLASLVPARDWDVAFAVWWLDVDDDPAAPRADLVRCLAQAPRPSDGGTDARGGP